MAVVAYSSLPDQVANPQPAIVATVTVVRHEHENDDNEALRWHFLDMPDCNRQEKLRIAALEMLPSERSIFRN